MAEPKEPIISALESEDPIELARHATIEELERLKVAEALVEARFQRKRRTSRFTAISQATVSLVALSGLLVNAYQSRQNTEKQKQQAETDNSRWQKEFERAQQADKYRAFFETSALATDIANPDKRLVGYSLLQEFVQDKYYNNKATLMLEESLAQELRGDKDPGLDEAHQNAVTAILTALSETEDCHALERAARSMYRLSSRYAKSPDVEESREVFGLYVRRLVGRGASICGSLKEFHVVRRPMRETLMKNPVMGDLKAPVSVTRADRRIAEILVERCADELATSGSGECATILTKYHEMCLKEDAATLKEDGEACGVIKTAAAALPAAPSNSPPGAPK